MSASLLDSELMAIEKDLGRFLIKDDKMVATTLTRIFGDSRGRSKMGNLGANAPTSTVHYIVAAVNEGKQPDQ